jgi:hypothetical protein
VTAGASEQGRGVGRTNAATWLAWLLWALTAVCAISLLVVHEKGSLTVVLLVGTWAVTSSTVGVLIVSRRPGNAIGWILCVSGLLFAFSIFSSMYAIYALVTYPGSLPAGEVAAWFATWVQQPVYLLFVYLFLLFPDGRPLSPRWRPLLWINGFLMATGIVAHAFDPGRIMSDEPISNPLGIEAAGEGFAVVSELVSYLTALMMVVSVVSLYLRFRRAGGIERQQIKWLAYSAALLGVVAVVGTIDELLLGVFGWRIFPVLVVTLFGIPLSIGAAVLRYRLYDIDIVINRTLVYGTLTAMLALVYFGGVATTQTIFRTLTGQQQQPQLAIVISTLVIAALFNPLRKRVQAFVDQHFYRRKYDAVKTLEAFGSRLREETDLDALSNDLVGVVRVTMQPEHVSLWLRSVKSSRGEQPD